MKLDLFVLQEMLVNFLRDEAKKVGFSKVVLGLSGGIDSALVAYLAVRAFGPQNVLAIKMPYKTSNQSSLDDADLVINNLNIPSKTVDITPMVEPYFESEKDMTKLRKGNMMARARMNVLFDNSAKENALVLGTSNKTELLLGYSTQFGDGACSINAIGDLFKTQVWALSEHLGVPNSIIHKKPSADLWTGQTDEDDLGFTYKMADEILYSLFDELKTRDEVVKMGYDPEIVDKIIKRVKLMQYKRMMPMICKVSNRTVGESFIYPRDWGV